MFTRGLQYYCTKHEYNIRLYEMPPESTAWIGEYYRCPACGTMYKVFYPGSAAEMEHLIVINNPDWDDADATI